jgi:hypothetical protein
MANRKDDNRKLFEEREKDMDVRDKAGRDRREAEGAKRLKNEELTRQEQAQMEAIRKNNDDAYRGELLDQINNRHRTR